MTWRLSIPNDSQFMLRRGLGILVFHLTLLLRILNKKKSKKKVKLMKRMVLRRWDLLPTPLQCKIKWYSDNSNATRLWPIELQSIVVNEEQSWYRGPISIVVHAEDK